MTGPVPLAAITAALALALLLSHPGAGLARLRAPSRRAGVAPERDRLGASRRRLIAVALAFLVLVLVPGVAAVALAALFGGAAFVLLGRLPARATGRAPAAQVAEALDLLAVCLDVGRPMSLAVAAVAEASPEPSRALLRRVGAHLALGRAGPEAWEELRDDPVWGSVAVDIARAERSGTPVAALLRVHAEDARRESRDAAIKAARTVGVRSVMPLMLCFLPAFILVGVVPIIAGLLRGFFG